MSRREQSSTHRLDRLSSHSDRGRRANYTCVRVRQVVPFRTALEGPRKGVMPEVLQTSYGSLTVGLDAKPGQILRQAEPRVGPDRLRPDAATFINTCSGPGSGSAGPGSEERLAVPARPISPP
jgi:hypothetical protein